VLKCKENRKGGGGSYCHGKGYVQDYSGGAKRLFGKRNSSGSAEERKKSTGGRLHSSYRKFAAKKKNGCTRGRSGGKRGDRGQYQVYPGVGEGQNEQTLRG